MNTLLTVLACIILAPFALAIVWRVAVIVWLTVRLLWSLTRDQWVTFTLPDIADGEVEIKPFAGESHFLTPRLERSSWDDMWCLVNAGGVPMARCQGYIGKHPAPRKGNRWVWEADR